MNKTERESFMADQDSKMEMFFARQDEKLALFLDDKIPEMIASELKTNFRGIGIDCEKPFEMQKKFQFLDRLMKDSETLRNKFLTGAPGFIIGLVLILAVMGGGGIYFYHQVKGLLATHNISMSQPNKKITR